MRSAWWLVIAADLVLAGPAFASRIHTDAELVGPVVAQRFDAIVMVEVLSRSDGQGGAWRALGRRARTIVGAPASETFEFRGGEVISSEAPPLAPPKEGEAWVLYLNWRDGAWSVGASYPWDLVSPHDARLWQIPRPTPNLTVEGLIPTPR